MLLEEAEERWRGAVEAVKKTKMEVVGVGMSTKGGLGLMCRYTDGRLDCERYQRDVSHLTRQIDDLRQQLQRIPLIEEENKKLARALGEQWCSGMVQSSATEQSEQPLVSRRCGEESCAIFPGG